MHLTASPIDWYAARAGGIVAYVLLSANVGVGILMSGKKSMKRWPRFALEDVHRFTGLLVGTFLVLHIGAVAIDSYLPFSITSLIVPFTASYRPIWTGLGIVAAELLLALAFTNHYRNISISYRFWRRVHFVNFAVWIAATLHGLGSGTDRSAAWMDAIYAVAVAVVVGLTAWRVLRRWKPEPALLRLAPTVTAMIGALVVAGLARGPLRFQPKEWNAASFTDTLAGQDPERLRRHARDGVDGRQRVGLTARARPRRSADLPDQAAVHGVPDGVPAERGPLHGNRDPGARLQLLRDVPHARREHPLRGRALAAEPGRNGHRRHDHVPRVMPAASPARPPSPRRASSAPLRR